MRTRQRCAPVNCSTDNGSTEPKLQSPRLLWRSVHLGCGRVGGIRMDVPAVVGGREPRSDRHGRDAEILRAMPRSAARCRNPPRRDFHRSRPSHRRRATPGPRPRARSPPRNRGVRGQDQVGKVNGLAPERGGVRRGVRDPVQRRVSCGTAQVIGCALPAAKGLCPAGCRPVTRPVSDYGRSFDARNNEATSTRRSLGSCPTRGPARRGIVHVLRRGVSRRDVAAELAACRWPLAAGTTSSWSCAWGRPRRRRSCP